MRQEEIWLAAVALPAATLTLTPGCSEAAGERFAARALLGFT